MNTPIRAAAAALLCVAAQAPATAMGDASTSSKATRRCARRARIPRAGARHEDQGLDQERITMTTQGTARAGDFDFLAGSWTNWFMDWTRA